MTDEGLERNKRAVVEFYDQMFNQCKPAEAIASYAGDTYTQHNPGVRDGVQPLSHGLRRTYSRSSRS